MKRLLIFVPAVLICIIAVITPLLTGSKKDKTVSFAVEPIISSGYDEIFGNRNEASKPYSIHSSDDTASITYDLAVDEDNPMKGYVTAQINLLINGKSCSCSVSGEAEAMGLTDDKYWEGCLRGDLYVESDVYNDVYVHFSKLDSRDDIRLSLSISTEHGSTSFMFGDLLLDEQTYSEIESHRNYSNSQANYDTQETVDP